MTTYHECSTCGDVVALGEQCECAREQMVDDSGEGEHTRGMTDTTLVSVPSLRTGDRVRVAGHTLQLTNRSDHGDVVNFATVVVASDPGADPFVTRNADHPCDCGRVCQGWHVQGNALAMATVVEFA